MRLLRYGNEEILEEHCQRCQRDSFITNGKFRCCGQTAPNVSPTTWKQVSPVAGGRKKPPLWAQQETLNAQDHRCLYCEVAFETAVYRDGKRCRRYICWDHFRPWSYSFDNRNENLVAACNLCNGIKSDLIFRDFDECQAFIQLRWQSKHYTTKRPDIELSAVRDAVYP